jgi:hypothetical protein
MEDADHQRQEDKGIAASVVADVLLATTALLTGPFAVVCSVLGGAMLMMPGKRPSGLPPTSWPDNDAIDAPPIQPTVSMGSVAAEPARHWRETTSKTHTARRGR